MVLTLRAKLLAIVVTATLAFVVLVTAGTITSNEVSEQLVTIRDRQVPRAALRPSLQRELERLGRALQDSVAAQDPEALSRTVALHDAFRSRLRSAGKAVDPARARALARAFDDYYETSVRVSRRLISGETGEALVEAMGAMQTKQAQVSQIIEKATAFEQTELASSIARVARAQSRASNVRTVTSVVCLALVIFITLALSRGMLRSLASLTSGLERFGRGQLEHRISIEGDDELAAVARRANEMAVSLERLGLERDHVDWLKSGQSELTRQIRGELTSAELASRSVSFLAQVLEAPAAVMYGVDDARVLRPLGVQPADGPHQAFVPPSFAIGEGVVGQAAQRTSLTLLTDPPADYLRVRSGLGEGAPRVIALVPLWHSGRPIGVIELASFKPWSPRSTELLEAVAEGLAIALEVARAREGISSLLVETQALAARLAAREEDLRRINEELQAQHEELRQTNEELAQQARVLEEQRRTLQLRNTELDDARLRLEEKAEELTTVSAYKSQFLANMSHELRTPLNSMLLLSNMLAENDTGNLTPKQVEYCRTIDQAGRDLLALINQVLDLAKIESGKQEVDARPVPLAELADRARRVFGPLARDKGLTLTVSLSPDMPATITTDGPKVDQIVNNLLGNAIKFTPRGRVSLHIGRPNPEVPLPRADLVAGSILELVVQDEGPGIAPQDMTRVFSPFEQVDAASNRRHGGTGLGLTIARDLARLLGGELTLTSTVGEGSTFRCILPFVAAPGAVVGKAPFGPLADPPRGIPRSTGLPAIFESLADDPSTLAPGEGYLLVIEDDPAFAVGLAEVIRKQNLACIVARDGASGMRIARERRPTGIILDVLLPDVDGWTVMERLQSDPATADVPVHFVSAVEGSERGARMGAIGYLVKPAGRADITRVVQRLAARRPTKEGILVVDADGDAADAMVNWLSGEGLQARAVRTGRDAIEALGSQEFGCVILDPDLPDIEGAALLEVLQERFGAERPRVIVHTARAVGKQEAQRLESYAEAIVLDQGSSEERLLDEIRLFVRRLAEGLQLPRVARANASDDRLTGRRVLVVDDDMRTVYALSAMLRAKGALVEVADTGQAALDALEEHPLLEVVLMDMMMPEMDGYEAIGLIRQDARFKDLPVIALTAKAMKGDEAKCLEAGANAYLPKPIDTDRLLDLMHAHLRKKPSGGRRG